MLYVRGTLQDRTVSVRDETACRREGHGRNQQYFPSVTSPDSRDMMPKVRLVCQVRTVNVSKETVNKED